MSNLIKYFLVVAISGLCFIRAQSDTTAPQSPQGVRAFGYEKNLDVEWYHNSEPDLAGYNIYIKSGQNYNLFTKISREKSYYSINTNFIGVGYYFKVSVYDSSGNESPLSDSVYAITHIMTDEEFLDMVQRSTFRYFYDYAHPVSGLSRERLGWGETVTSGGSGFGVMALLVGIERGFITRQQGVERMLKILNFLKNKANKFHGAFSHWLNGTTGAVIPFSTIDNGGDLVETSYMIQGLLAVRQYFGQTNADEQQIRDLCTEIWNGVEWDWYRRTSTSSFLYWHWSPNYNWQMNMTVRGPNEAMIVYLLGIASTTHGVPASLFHNGWASSPYYVNTKSFYGYRIWVGWDYGGPLFFSHYSFLGFDPRNKKDSYCNYFLNSKNITLIHKEYCTDNPKNYTGYNVNCWGLTASDDPTGYRVHEPTNDNGTITPSAALSSLPYTPQESIEVIKHLYRTYGSDVWGEYGFKDAFNPTVKWYAGSYLAIDQGPIIVMIENYRSELLWEMFMANPEIQPMLNAIGFVPDSTTDVIDGKDLDYSFELEGNYPNPFNPNTVIRFELPQNQKVSIKVYNTLGQQVRDLLAGELQKGTNGVLWDGKSDDGFSLPSGVYIYKIESEEKMLSSKMILQK
ncbi:MAG: hypothetical protein A2315_03800 [Ignavibacteria bacterium RIFOXYB2_FULL_35_12]|nr:MAG: hypothetical protein A2058_00055 [Ignavibacteria bacterium GWA2_36_19]OGU51242.1 MAG: hypothetical protein A2006_03515 [Ignavibacteria bacterium GWC2_35_8]OGU62992.1 MAG: hypothetical protein A2X60_00770 [Ignavibacteria bacterium GWF2_35_20]OGU86558.1 MAG: hypothetical protein A2492_01645 [Ignavibacteria bacterium RIFOXYC12_FULL_35_11]OGU89019.1 MAG: hypothetical protein A3K31_01380 [Ignavibacteria bacterium RIFOXYA12_FULL_35_25]OGU93352.1 MAG: hypothetical protein A2347_07355 [Ignavib